MAVRKDSIRGGVIIKWDSAGKPNWNLDKTLKICININNEIAIKGLNPAPKFREAVKSNKRSYLINWVQGCHFPWLNPR